MPEPQGSGIFLCTAEDLRQPLPANARQVPRKLIQSGAGSRKSTPFAGQSGAKVKNRSHFCGNGICTFGACDSRVEPATQS